MTDNYSFNKFCDLLSNSTILKKSTASGVSKQFQTYILDIKSQVLKELVSLKENKNDYLEYLINEIERQEYIKEADIKYVDKWLKEYNTTIEEILKYDDYRAPIYVVLDRHYNDMRAFSPEKDKAFLVQSAFLNYFCCLYADELITFLESKKQIKVIETKVSTKPIQMIFKDEYLKTFCKEVSEERVIRETSFLRVYECSITHYAPYLETEIVENLLHIPNDKKEDYINLVIDKLSKTPYANLPDNFIDKWLDKYNVEISEFPNFSNKELSDLLQKNYTGYYQESKTQDLIEDIQIDFYCYASKLEVKKMIDFAKNKSETKKEAKGEVKDRKIIQLTVNQIVLLLQETGFFAHPKIENSTKVSQSILISSITGLNQKNIKTAIQKLEKKPTQLGVNYQRDLDKVDDVLDSME